MRDAMIQALKLHAKANSQLHMMNIEVYLKNPAGIGEHSDVLGSIQDQLDIIAKAQERIDVINKHFLLHH